MESGNKRVDSINLLQSYFKYLLEKRNLLFGIAMIGLAFGLAFAILAKPRFYSRLVFLINESKTLSGNPLSALAGQFGISQSGPSITEDRVFYLAYTKRILGDALLSEYKPGQSLADRIIESGNMKNAWKDDTTLVDFDRFKAGNMDELTYAENKIMDGMINGIILSNRLSVESYKKKTSSFVGSTNSGIMVINFHSEDEDLARIFPIAIYNKLSEFYSQAVTKSLQKNFEMLDHRADSLKEVLFDLENETANALDAGFNVTKYRGRIRENRLKRDLEIQNLIYAEVVKNRELAKFNLDQEKPVFQLIDEPQLPLEFRTKSKPIFTFLGLVGFLMAGIFLVTIQYLIVNKANFKNLVKV